MTSNISDGNLSLHKSGFRANNCFDALSLFLSSHKLNSIYYIPWPTMKSVYAGVYSYCWIPTSVYHCPSKSREIFIHKNIPFLLYLLLFSLRICRHVKFSTWDPRMYETSLQLLSKCNNSLASVSKTLHSNTGQNQSFLFIFFLFFSALCVFFVFCSWISWLPHIT